MIAQATSQKGGTKTLLLARVRKSSLPPGREWKVRVEYMAKEMLHPKSTQKLKTQPSRSFETPSDHSRPRAPPIHPWPGPNPTSSPKLSSKTQSPRPRSPKRRYQLDLTSCAEPFGQIIASFREGFELRGGPINPKP